MVSKLSKLPPVTDVPKLLPDTDVPNLPLKVGDKILVTGKYADGNTKFSVNLINGGEYLLHVDFRPPSKVITLFCYSILKPYFPIQIHSIPIIHNIVSSALLAVLTLIILLTIIPKPNIYSISNANFNIIITSP